SFPVLFPAPSYDDYRDLHSFPTRRSSDLKVFSPNGTLANSVIRNYTKITNRRFEYIVGISYEDNIKTAQQTILAVLNNNGIVLRSEEHTSELQSRENLVCRLLLEKKKKKK